MSLRGHSSTLVLRKAAIGQTMAAVVESSVTEVLESILVKM